jgi:hypothetical protein
MMEANMATENKPRIVTPDERAAAPEAAANPAIVPQVDQDQLDEEEREFRALRRDLPGVKGTSAAGIVSISVGKTPTKNEFFRTRVPRQGPPRRQRRTRPLQEMVGP